LPADYAIAGAAIYLPLSANSRFYLDGGGRAGIGNREDYLLVWSGGLFQLLKVAIRNYLLPQPANFR